MEGMCKVLMYPKLLIVLANKQCKEMLPYPKGKALYLVDSSVCAVLSDWGKSMVEDISMI